MNEKTDAFDKLRLQFEETRVECVKVRTDYEELEERFFNSKVKSMDEVERSLKVRHLHAGELVHVTIRFFSVSFGFVLFCSFYLTCGIGF